SAGREQCSSERGRTVMYISNDTVRLEATLRDPGGDVITRAALSLRAGESSGQGVIRQDAHGRQDRGNVRDQLVGIRALLGRKRQRERQRCDQDGSRRKAGTNRHQILLGWTHGMLCSYSTAMNTRNTVAALLALLAVGCAGEQESAPTL